MLIAVLGVLGPAWNCFSLLRGSEFGLTTASRNRDLRAPVRVLTPFSTNPWTYGWSPIDRSFGQSRDLEELPNWTCCREFAPRGHSGFVLFRPGTIRLALGWTEQEFLSGLRWEPGNGRVVKTTFAWTEIFWVKAFGCATTASERSRLSCVWRLKDAGLFPGKGMR